MSTIPSRCTTINRWVGKCGTHTTNEVYFEQFNRLNNIAHAHYGMVFGRSVVKLITFVPHVYVPPFMGKVRVWFVTKQQADAFIDAVQLESWNGYLRYKVFICANIPVAKCQYYEDCIYVKQDCVQGTALLRDRISAFDGIPYDTDTIISNIVNNIAPHHTWERTCALWMKYRINRSDRGLPCIDISADMLYWEFLKVYDLLCDGTPDKQKIIAAFQSKLGGGAYWKNVYFTKT